MEQKDKRYNYNIIASYLISNCIALHIIELNEEDETLKVAFSVDGELKKASRSLKIYYNFNGNLYFNYKGKRYYLNEFIRSNY